MATHTDPKQASQGGQGGAGPYAGFRRFIGFDPAIRSAAPEEIVGIAGRILRIEPVRGLDRRAHRLVLRDLEDRAEFKTAPFSDENTLRTAQDTLFEGLLTMVWGAFPDPTENLLALHDLSPLTRPTYLLGPTPQEIAEIDALIDQVREAPGGPLHYVRARARRALGLAEESLAPRYRLAEDMVIYQALSYAQIDPDLNSRLSIYLFSNPGTGKSKLGQLARLLHPVSAQVQPTNVSPPGLTSKVSLQSGRWKIEPGVLAACSGGACVLEDLHRLARRDLNTVQGMLMPVLENGRVRSFKAAAGSFEARVALLMTGNRLSLRDGRMVMDPDEAGPRHKAAEINMPFDVMSRVDMLVNMSLEDDALPAAMEMASQPSQREHPRRDETRPSHKGPTPEQEEARHLQLFLLRLKERFEVVDTSEVEEVMEQAMLERGVVLREFTSRLRGTDADNFDGEGLLRREAITLRKIVGAVARGEGTDVATVGHVRRAMELMTPKLEVIRWMCGLDEKIRPLPDPEVQVRMALLASEARWRTIVSSYGGQRVTAEEVARALGCADKVVRRELAKRRVVPEGGWYLIPVVCVPGSGDLQDELVKPAPEQEAVPEVEAAAPEHVFEDHLIDQAPREVQPMVAGLARVPRAEQHAIVATLWNLALQDYGDLRYRSNVEVVISQVRHKTERDPVPSPEEQEAFAVWLAPPGREERALRALSVFVEAGLGVPARNYRTWIAEAERRDGPLPDGVRKTVDAVFARQAYYEAEAEKEWRESRPPSPPPRFSMTWGQWPNHRPPEPPA